MKKVLVTGSNGFVGRNLCLALAQLKDVQLFRYDVDSSPEELDQALAVADVIFHLAGVNRPSNIDEFKTGNADFTESLCASLLSRGRTPLIVLSSSTQAALDNPYGISKRQAEAILLRYGEESEEQGADPISKLQALRAHIYRLPNVFGKWCRPNYNSAVATWCHNIANGLPIQVRDPNATVTLVYVDDVVNAFINELRDFNAETQRRGGVINGLCELKDRKKVEDEIGYRCVPVTYTKTLGEITTLIESFRSSRSTLQVSDQADGFTKKLFATYLSYLPTDQFSYPLKMNVDARGSFTEILKTSDRGQVSVNISKPGIVKGNHWHHTKVEKFLVVSGKGVIRFRKVGSVEQGAGSVEQGAGSMEQGAGSGERGAGSGERGAGSGVIEYQVSGEKLEVVDVPPGYTHNIENLGDTDMVTVMWANEAFDIDKPDTFFEKV